MMPKKVKITPPKRKKAPLSRKLFGAIAFIIVIFVTAIMYVSYKSLDLIFLFNAGVISFQSAEAIENEYDNPDSDFISFIDSIELNNEISIEILTPADNLVYSTSYKGEIGNPPFTESDALPDSYIKHFNTTETDTYKINNYHFEIQQDELLNVEYLVFIKKMDNGCTMKIYKQKTAFDRAAKIVYIFIATVCSVGLLVILFLTLLFVKRFTKPLKKISEITTKISRLDFSEKCPSANVLEISNLSDNINNMSSSLESALIDIREKNEKLQQDIEQERTIEQLRGVFISGASHELKTPISIIQGYAEGLKLISNQDNETEAKYCDIIIEETARMNQLVMKMLEITKYRSGGYELTTESFNIYELVQDWFTRNSKNLEAKGIVYLNMIDKNLTGSGDTLILSSVVNNYLSNAVSHTDGEMKITAYCDEKDGKYRVYVFNTGNHIEDKDIDKIWDSFYRADKAHSRSQGRYGLGLAIVAAIQQLHNCDYGVENVENGVRFWFDINNPGL